MKGKRLLALLLAFILAFPAAWGNTALVMETQAEEVQEQRIQNVREESENYTWVFSEEAYTVSLNTEGLEDITQVQWGITLYQDGEPVNISELTDVAEEEIYAVDSENYSITLYGEGLSQVTEYMRDSQWFDLGVTVSYGEEETFEQWIGVALVTEEYYVDYLAGQAENQMLPNESKYLNNNLGVSVWDADHPHGEYFDCPITSVEILAQYSWGENGESILVEEDIFWLEGGYDNGWNICSNDHGYAEVRAYYTNYNGEEAIYDFEIYSIGEVYYLELYFENDTNNILTNFAETVDTRLTKRYQDENGNNQYDVEVTDYFLEITSEYDTSIVTANISESGTQIELQTAATEANMGFEINACMMVDEEQYYLTGTWFDINILNEYYNIEPTGLENPDLGETLDLSGLSVYTYNAEYPEGQEASSENVRLYVGYYDESVWEPSEEVTEDSLPTFLRTSKYGTDFQIIAEYLFEDGWSEITQRWFWFDELDYSVWLEDLQNGDHGWIYVNDEVTFHLNTDNLADKENYEVTFDLGLHQEETQEFIPFEEQTGLFETVTEDGQVTGITIKGSTMKAMEESLAEGGWFWVRVTVTVGEQEVYTEWRGIELREVELDYHYNEWGFGMLPHWDHGIGKEFGYYLRNAENPDGYDGSIWYTDIQVEIIEGEEDALVADEWEDGNGWNLHANSYGHAVVTLTHEDVLNPEETMEHSFDVWIGQDVWNIEFTSSTGTSDICPGGTMDLTATLYRHCYTDEEGHFEGDTENVYYEWGYIDGVNQELIDYEAEGNVLHITAREDAPYDHNTCVYLRVYMTDESGNIMQDENGNDIEVCYADYWLDIRNGFFTLLPLEISETLEVGETVEITPILRYVSETEDREYTENVAFNWQWDPEAVEITDSEGNILSPEEETDRSPYGTGTYTIKKIAAWGTDLWLRAYIEEDGNYNEVFCRNLYVENVDYNVDFTDLQNGDHGWVYVDDEVTFHLNTDNLADKENYEITFDLGIDQDGQFVPFEDQTGLFEVVTENDKVIGIKIKGSEMKAMEESLAEGGWFCIRVTVTANGQEVHSSWRGIELREVELDYHYNDWGFAMLPHWDHGIGKELGYYLRDAENPDGYDGQIQYTDIQVEIIDGEEDALVADEWEDGNGWNLHANSYGHAVVTLAHEDVLNPEETMEHSFDVWIGQDVWNISFSSSTGTSDICPGGTMDLTATIERHCYNEEDGHFEGATEPLYYEWGYIDGANQGIIDYETEGNVVHITAREDAPYHDGTGLYLRLYMLDESGNIMQDENGNNMEVCYADYWINIREAYFQILPLEIDEPFELGETVEITPTLRFINETENVEYMDNTVFEWEWNAEEIEITDSEGNVLTPNENGRSPYGTGTYTLKKLVSWDSNVWLRAYEEENGEYYEISYRGFHVKGIDYNSWFEKDRGEEWTTYLFADEEDYQVTLNTDNLRDENGNIKENISIEWSVCTVDEEGNVVKTATNGEEYTISEDGTTIHLNGKLLQENGFANRSRIYVNVESNGINVQGEPYCLYFWIQEEYVELEHDYDSDTLLAEIGGWYYAPEGMNAYVRNVVYPDGADLVFEIRNIESNVTDDAEGDVFAIAQNEDGSWRITPLRCGQAQIVYTIYHETLGELVVTRDKAVGNEIYRINIYSDTHTLGMLPNSELNLITEVIQFKSYEDGSWEESYAPKERYEVSYDYNQELINIDESDKVTSYEQLGETGIYVEAKVEMLNGTDYYYTNTSTHITVAESDLKIYGEDRTVMVDDTISISDLNIQMIEVTVDNPEGTAYEPESIEIMGHNWLQLSEDGQSFTIIADALGEEFPVSRRLHYKGSYNGWEYYDWLTLTIDKEEVVTTPVTEVFSDITSDKWYIDSVQYVYDHGLMSGSKGLFNPTGNVTRAQVVSTLYKLVGSPEVTDYSACEELKDVQRDAWYTNAVCWAYSTGVGTGNSSTMMFNMNTPVTRQQLASFFYGFAEYMGLDTTISADLSGLKNADQVASYAEAAVKWAVGAGIISGSKTTDANGNTVYDLNPRGTATRVQLAAILQKFCEKNNL